MLIFNVYKGECIGAIVTEEGIAINPNRKDLLAKLEGKTEKELGFKLVPISYLRERGIEKAGRMHTLPHTLGNFCHFSSSSFA